jgi:hypothetical protein
VVESAVWEARGVTASGVPPALVGFHLALAAGSRSKESWPRMNADGAVTDRRGEPITHLRERFIGVHRRPSAAKKSLPAALPSRGRRLAWMRGYERFHGIAVVLASSALFILTACEKHAPTPDTCIVPHESGFVTAGNRQERMTMMQNGKPCETFLMNNKGGIGVGKIVAPATHGVASLRFVYEATVLSYTPAHDFVGNDRFTVAIGSDFTETVDVAIVPSSSKP